MSDLPAMYRVLRADDEAENVRVVWFEGRVECEPGRFFMVWLPGLDEKPYAVSHLCEDRFAVTVQVRGRFSRALADLSPGDLVGLRGPYGRGFEVGAERVCIVAGGTGICAIARLHEAHPEAPVLYGAHTASQVIFRRRFPEMRLFTDDGSAGEKGFPTDALARVIEERAIELVCTCGPEAMMRRAFDICEAKGVACQASLERYMKCGIGVCGMCACDDRLVCRDGPVFGSEVLRTLKDFGRFAMTKEGRRVPVERYFGTTSPPAR